MWPEDPNAPQQPSRPIKPLLITEEEVHARREACVCGRLPFYLGENVTCALHDSVTIFNNLVRVRRSVRAGGLTGDTAAEPIS